MAGSCPWCEDPDAEVMAFCEICQRQYHLKCASVSDASKRWWCADCRKKRAADKEAKLKREEAKLLLEKQKSSRSGSIVGSNKPGTELLSQTGQNYGAEQGLLTQQKDGSTKPKEDIGKQTGSDTNKNITEVVSVPPTTGKSQLGSVSKRGSSISSRRRAIELQQLQEEGELAMRQLEEKQALARDLLKKKHDLEAESSGTSSIRSDTSLASTINRTIDWVNSAKGEKISTHQKVTFGRQPNQHRSTMKPLQTRTQTPQEPTNKEHGRGNRRAMTPVDLRASTPNQWLRARSQDQFGNSFRHNNTSRLEADHITSRHVLPRDLPQFSGNPQEWPLFMSSFANSTERCGFSNEENLIRLQKALKGNALEAVRGKLMLPNTVPDVMNTLRVMFGRPEVILRSILEQVRREPPIKHEALDQIIRYALTVQNLCATIRASELTAHLSNPMLVQELVDRLPPRMRLDWAIHKRRQECANLADFDAWLYDIAEAASEVTDLAVITTATSTSASSNRKSTRQSNQQERRGHEYVNVTEKTEMNKEKCLACPTKHRLEDCAKFKAMKKRDRWDIVLKSKLCGNCLEPHDYRRCENRKECGIDGCKKTHHVLLHGSPKLSEQTVVTAEIHAHDVIKKQVLFRIVPVQIHGKNGQTMQTHAFLDEGSSISLMDDEVAETLGLEGSKEELCLKWTGNTVRVEKNSRRVTCEISGVQPNARKFRLAEVRTVTKLGLPSQSLELEKLKSKFGHLQGLPITEYADAIPRILIGIGHGYLGVPLEKREGNLGDPIAVKTRLGWTISGSIEGSIIHQDRFEHYHICECQTDQKLHQLITEFFSLENFGVSNTANKVESKQDQRAREILLQNTKRIGDRYETTLLWRQDVIEFPKSKPMAMRRLLCLEKKFANEPHLREILSRQIKEYVDKGYARQLTSEEASLESPRTWYLPLFSISNPNKPGKVRMVWDAAATVQGVSLNSMLLKGPDLLSPLPEVLSRFRQYKVAVCGDIKEMFHQVKIAARDRESQRFLWRDDVETEPLVYEMMVMTFGSTCSPSAAQFVKNSNAEDYFEISPRASTAIRENHYVDDWLDSFPSSQEAAQVAQDVRTIHAKAGFEIRNWLSNNNFVLKTLGDSAAECGKQLNNANELHGSKVLGMYWVTETDDIQLSINLGRMDPEIINGHRRPTKREVLKIMMTIFDPLGIIAFVMVYIKILLQDIWRSGIDWDHSINEEQQTNWMRWIRTLPELSKVKIPRCYSELMSKKPAPKVDLHVFVDASEKAYAAVAYFRVTANEKIECALVSAKSKVAPLKPLSIPRLELLAAVLGARLAKSILQAHTLVIGKTYFWSDSMNVLAWIRSEKRRYSQFVAFRVGEILESTAVRDWRYIPTKLNVADEATKWVRNPAVENNCRWFEGPKFLMTLEDDWPPDRVVPQTNLEERVNAHRECLQPNASPDANRVTHWRILVRAQAYVLRVMRYNTIKKEERKAPLTAAEMSRAESELLRTTQRECYPEEVKTLSSNPPEKIETTSSIYQLSPFLDKEKVLRMKGRTEHAGCTDYDAKNPIILPREHRITKLILMSYHRRFHHHYHETTINEVRQKYWVPRLRTTFKTLIAKCQKCKNDKAKPVPPMMAALPKMRLATFTKPFTFTGLDFFGPMEVVVGRRIEKRWGALFTCLTLRAVHLEIAHSLSSDSCIMCIQNFIARRGRPQELWTDNGTNFRGADAELRKELCRLNHKEIENHFDRITWRFIPPGAPHMGGCWERMVRSIKNTLFAVLPARRPTDELLRNILMEAENIVNSRPLTYIPVEPGASEALTPNHFLLGSSNGTKPIGEFSADALVQRKNWRKAQHITTELWRRWIKEYLPIINRRTKWFQPTTPANIGDIGIIWDNNKKGSWQMGRIIEANIGQDNQTRRIVVKTATGVYTRPVHKFAKLDVATKAESNPQPSIGESSMPEREVLPQSTHGRENVARSKKQKNCKFNQPIDGVAGAKNISSSTNR